MFIAEMLALWTMTVIACAGAMALALWFSGAWVPRLTPAQLAECRRLAAERRWLRGRVIMAPTFAVEAGHAPVVSPSQPPPRRARRVPAMARTIMGQSFAPVPVPAVMVGARRDSSRPAWANVPARDDEEEAVMLIGGS